MNRGTLYSVFNGDKKLAQETFDRALRLYGFSAEEKSLLIRAFRLSDFSPEKLELMELFKLELSNAGKAPSCEKAKTKPLVLSNKSVSLGGREDFYSAIEAFLKIENENETAAVYTNYSFSDEQADRLVFDFVSENCRFTVRHAIRCGNSEKLRFKNCFASLKFAKLGHITTICEEDEPTFAFPTYFVGEKSVITFDEKSNTGLFTTSQPIATAYYISASRRDAKRKLLTTFSKRPPVLKNNVTMLTDPNRVDFSSVYPIFSFVTDDILLRALNEETPNRELTAHILRNYAATAKSSAPRMIITTKSEIERFAESGRVREISTDLLKPIAPKDREALLRRHKEEVLAPESRFLVFDDDDCALSEPLVLSVRENGVVIEFVRSAEKYNFVGAGKITVNNKAFVPLFDDYVTYLVTRCLVLSGADAARIIEKAIDRAQELSSGVQ